MFARRSRLVLAVLTAVVAALVVTLTPTVSSAVRSGVPGPIHAGNTYGWYQSRLTRWEFHGHKKREWRVHGPGAVRNQHGMLTLNTSDHGTVTATLNRRGHRTGRWEIRLRSRRYDTAHANYHVMTTLIPDRRHRYHCGGRNIALEDYRIGTHRTKFYIHTLPHHTFHARKAMRLHNDQWHTFAVEVTRRHISWFVDAHVVRTERRRAALQSVPLTVRFRMQGVPHQKMNRSRMQMDWLRYWTTDTPDTKSIKAPRTHLARFAKAC